MNRPDLSPDTIWYGMPGRQTNRSKASKQARTVSRAASASPRSLAHTPLPLPDDSFALKGPHCARRMARVGGACSSHCGLDGAADRGTRMAPRVATESAHVATYEKHVHHAATWTGDGHTGYGDEADHDLTVRR